MINWPEMRTQYSVVSLSVQLWSRRLSRPSLSPCRNSGATRWSAHIGEETLIIFYSQLIFSYFYFLHSRWSCLQRKIIIVIVITNKLHKKNLFEKLILTLALNLCRKYFTQLIYKIIHLKTLNNYYRVLVYKTHHASTCTSVYFFNRQK